VSNDTLYLARTVCVRPHHEDMSTFEIAWGEGSRRESFVTASPVLASVLATAPMKSLFVDEVARLAALLTINSTDAGELVAGLRDYGLYSAEPHDLAAAEQRWLDVADRRIGLAPRNRMTLRGYTTTAETPR
jgi:hypothetical protein